MLAVGHEAPFDHGREQMHLLADLSVTTKAVERTAEAIGEDIAARQAENMHRAMQLELSVAMGQRIPILYLQMDGTGVPMVGAETEGRAGKRDSEPAHTREAKLRCVFTQTTVDRKGHPVRDDGSTSYVGAIETAEEFGPRLITKPEGPAFKMAANLPMEEHQGQGEGHHRVLVFRRRFPRD